MTDDNVRSFSPGGKIPEAYPVPEPGVIPVAPESQARATPDPPPGQSYKMELVFNSQAQLTRVNYPADLTLAMAANHLAVAVLFLAQQLVEADK
jgi:hypothetical protein